MAANLRSAPLRPPKTFWQALQAVWLVHMVFHSTLNANALGRLDQYLWPYLEAVGAMEAGGVRREYEIDRPSDEGVCQRQSGLFSGAPL